MTTILQFASLLIVVIFGGQNWNQASTAIAKYHYDAAEYFIIDRNIESEAQNLNYDDTLNLHYCCSEALNSDLQEKIRAGSFFALVGVFDVTKGAGKGLETRGVRPGPGERTIQGQVDAATKADNPTIQRGGQDLVRLRSSGHAQVGATATPQNVRNVTPDGRVFTGKGADRAVTPRGIRELHKAQTGQGTSTIRTRSGR